jgi:hypothetical protein
VFGVDPYLDDVPWSDVIGYREMHMFPDMLPAAPFYGGSYAGKQGHTVSYHFSIPTPPRILTGLNTDPLDPNYDSTDPHIDPNRDISDISAMAQFALEHFFVLWRMDPDGDDPTSGVEAFDIYDGWMKLVPPGALDRGPATDFIGFPAAVQGDWTGSTPNPMLSGPRFLMEGVNSFAVNPAQPIQWGLGISVRVSYRAKPGSILFAGAGARFRAPG